MATALPSAIQLKLEQALSQWQQWQQPPSAVPVVEAPLTGGISNHSIKVGDGKRSWVVRLDGIDPLQLGLSRSAEWRALGLAAARGLAPKPSYCNPEIGCLVYSFCPVATEVPTREQELASLGRLLRAIHQLPAIKFRLQPARRVEHYLRRLPEEKASNEFTAACHRIEQHNAPPVLCHNDLLAANRIWSEGRLLALDWEYAASGDPWFDIAAIAEGDELSAAELETLLQAWLERGVTETERQRLNDQRSIYRELARLWSLAYTTLATDSAR